MKTFDPRYNNCQNCGTCSELIWYRGKKSFHCGRYDRAIPLESISINANDRWLYGDLPDFCQDGSDEKLWPEKNEGKES